MHSISMSQLVCNVVLVLDNYFRFAKYKELKSKTTPVNQPALTSFGYSASDQYSYNHPRQKAITAAIINDLIIDCSMPLSLVEKPGFRNFMAAVDPKYVNFSRATVTSKITEMASVMENKIKEAMASANNLSVTVDIWSDRKMRGFLGVTGHTMEVNESTKELSLKSYLLSCERFKGSHTGERISTAFEGICDKYDVRSKLNYIICDNAANMKKAFTVCLFREDDANIDDNMSLDMDEEGEVDDDSLWEPIEAVDQRSVDSTMARYCRHQRLQCYCHTLQLVVGDGLKDAKCLRPTLARACRLSSLLHTSSSFKDKFEDQFGTSVGIPAAVITRWNSTFRQIQSITKLNYSKLGEVCDAAKEKRPSEREWNQMKEFVEIMKPFAEATDLLQGEKAVTISSVVPSVLSINHHLVKLELKTDRYLMPLIHSLHSSLERRFSGVFINVKMKEPPKPTSQSVPVSQPFSERMYLLAALLDPTFALMWVENDVLVEEEIRSALKRSLKG